ncbi:unnamed protein product, partial [Porites evermanni]
VRQYREKFTFESALHSSTSFNKDRIKLSMSTVLRRYQNSKLRTREIFEEKNLIEQTLSDLSKN